MSVKPGDIVEHGDARRVVVDIAHDEESGDLAVLRPEADLAGESMVAAPVESLTIVGHASNVPGWHEESPGVWRQA